MADVALLQFRYSPYNEKVRWALDLKRVAHTRRSLLPGPHALALLPRTRQTETPVLRLDGQWIVGSAAIVAALDRRYPDPPLRPASPAEQAEAREVEALFDDRLVPRMRRAALATLMTDPPYMCGLFGMAYSALALAVYRATFPVAQLVIRAKNGVTGQAAIEDGEAACREALEFVAARSAATGYLVGARFSSADLAAAAGLAMVCDPAASPMEQPKPRPAAAEALTERCLRHPGAAWLRRIYATHRGATHDFEGRSPY